MVPRVTRGLAVSDWQDPGKWDCKKNEDHAELCLRGLCSLVLAGNLMRVSRGRFVASSWKQDKYGLEM